MLGLNGSCWGKGVATRALLAFLFHDKVRPYANAAKDNIASLRVLENVDSFLSAKARDLIGKGKGFSNARGEEVEEFILRLERSACSTQGPSSKASPSLLAHQAWRLSDVCAKSLDDVPEVPLKPLRDF